MLAQKNNIAGFDFDFSFPVNLYMGGKYWAAQLKGKQLVIVVACIKDGKQVQSSRQQIVKQYDSNQQAFHSICDKIKQKLQKGYKPDQIQKMQKRKIIRPSEQFKQKVQDKVQKVYKSMKDDNFSGSFFTKGKDYIKIQIMDEYIRIQKGTNNKLKQQNIENYTDNTQALQIGMHTVQQFKKMGYKENQEKFIYSLTQEEVEDFFNKTKNIKVNRVDQHRAITPTRVVTKTKNKNQLSIMGMTDQVMDRSRSVSPAKSSRSADDFQQQKDNNKLGKNSNGPSAVLLAKAWQDNVDPTGMYMSQKLDGVRCYWTGTQMYSRNGNRFYCPNFFTKGWPKSQLDGQLWVGRDKFRECISFIKKNTPIDKQWQQVRYLVFDCPGLNKPFRQRYQAMQTQIQKINSPYIKCHAHRVCTGFDDLFRELQQINRIKGQGLMLRNPQSFYQKVRSKNLLKVKTFYDDQATVIGHKAGTGRCQGMLGALKVRNTHGVEFQVGSGFNDQQRKRPPKIGSMITYKYQQFNKNSGKPRFPIYLRQFKPT